MKAMLRKWFGRDAGFTLTELAVAMLIIGVLASIAVPNFLGARNDSYDHEAQSAVTAALNAADTHYANYGDFSPSTNATCHTSGNTNLVSDLQRLEPNFSFVVDNAVSDNPRVVSVDAANSYNSNGEDLGCQVFYATALSRSGTCFVGRLSVEGKYLAADKTYPIVVSSDGSDSNAATNELTASAQNGRAYGAIKVDAPGAATNTGTETLAAAKNLCTANAQTGTSAGLLQRNYFDGWRTIINWSQNPGQPSGTQALVAAGTQPSGLTYGAGSVWVANYGSGDVTRIDPDTLATTTISLGLAAGSAPYHITFDGTNIWTANGHDGSYTTTWSVSKINVATSAVTTYPLDVGGPWQIAQGNSYPVTRTPAGIVFDSGSIWAASAGNDLSLAKINPADGTVTAYYSSNMNGDNVGSFNLRSDHTAIFGKPNDGGLLQHNLVNDTNGTTLQSYTGGTPAIAIDGMTIFAAGNGTGEISTWDASDNQTTLYNTCQTGVPFYSPFDQNGCGGMFGTYQGMTAYNGYLWVTSRNPGKITKFDISTRQVVASYPQTAVSHVLPSNGIDETFVIHGGGYIWALSGTDVARYVP
ncbi:unannotated protein [freshwater metagenome]|uniref:Unannotated protein n=1 Tax=freshwater metagenome TaxID=449393 RepID=A0A6J7EYF1_9ZZZZ